MKMGFGAWEKSTFETENRLENSKKKNKHN